MDLMFYYQPALDNLLIPRHYLCQALNTVTYRYLSTQQLFRIRVFKPRVYTVNTSPSKTKQRRKVACIFQQKVASGCLHGGRNRTLTTVSLAVSVLCRSAWHHRCPSVRPVTTTAKPPSIMPPRYWACTLLKVTFIRSTDTRCWMPTEHRPKRISISA